MISKNNSTKSPTYQRMRITLWLLSRNWAVNYWLSEISIKNLEKRIVNVEKQQSKLEYYNRCNNVKISGILNEVSDQKLKETTIRICKDYWIDVTTLDIKLSQTTTWKECNQEH